MVRRITVNGKRHTVANISFLERHAPRKNIHKFETQHLVGLTPEGVRVAIKHGQQLPKDLRLKTYYSPALRNRETAHYVQLGHLSKGGKVGVSKRKRETGGRQELIMPKGTNIFLDAKLVYGESKRLKNDWNKITENWVMGRYPSSKVFPSKLVAEEMIQKRLGLGKRATNAGRRDWLILNVTHDTQILAVLKELIGKNPFKEGFTLPKPNEGLTIYHTNAGREILEYQGRRLDVTKKINQIIKSVKKSQKMKNKAKKEK